MKKLTQRREDAKKKIQKNPLWPLRDTFFISERKHHEKLVPRLRGDDEAWEVGKKVKLKRNCCHELRKSGDHTLKITPDGTLEQVHNSDDADGIINMPSGNRQV